VAIEDTMAVGQAGMAAMGAGNARQPMGRDALATLVNASANYTSGAILHPRFTQPAGDPAFFPTAQPQNVLQEKGGARYCCEVNLPAPTSHEAGPTQANGRIIRGRGTGGSFWGGAAE
jgi:hypothetical protein